MKKKIVIVLATFLLVGMGLLSTGMAVQRGGHGSRGLGGPEAFGEGAGHEFGGRGGETNIPSERILSRVLNLTDEQIEELNLLKEAAQAAIEPLVEERHALREQLKAALDVDIPDALLVGELVVAGRDVGEAVRAVRESTFDSFIAMLTDEQIVTLEEMHDRRGSRRGSRGGSRGPGEDGF